MKPDSLFLNVGRGALVDEAALLAGLDAGHPAHAALDVLRVEPQPEDGPFWSRDDVTLTAHISAATHGSLLRTDAIFLENLERYLAGKPLEYLINPDTFA
jgi:phosphoglycerate dehydrogenase-like enzyme